MGSIIAVIVSTIVVVLAVMVLLFTSDSDSLVHRLYWLALLILNVALVVIHVGRVLQ